MIGPRKLGEVLYRSRHLRSDEAHEGATEASPVCDGESSHADSGPGADGYRPSHDSSLRSSDPLHAQFDLCLASDEGSARSNGEVERRLREGITSDEVSRSGSLRRDSQREAIRDRALRNSLNLDAGSFLVPRRSGEARSIRKHLGGHVARFFASGTMYRITSKVRSGSPPWNSKVSVCAGLRTINSTDRAAVAKLMSYLVLSAVCRDTWQYWHE